jgi:hypothetical protein
MTFLLEEKLVETGLAVQSPHKRCKTPKGGERITNLIY